MSPRSPHDIRLRRVSSPRVSPRLHSVRAGAAGETSWPEMDPMGVLRDCFRVPLACWCCLYGRAAFEEKVPPGIRGGGGRSTVAAEAGGDFLWDPDRGRGGSPGGSLRCLRLFLGGSRSGKAGGWDSTVISGIPTRRSQITTFRGVSMKTAVLLGAMALGLLGCASTSDIDLSKADSACGQQCAKTYSECVGKFTFFPIQTQHQCTDALRLCAQTCPPR